MHWVIWVLQHVMNQQMSAQSLSTTIMVVLLHRISVQDKLVIMNFRNYIYINNKTAVALTKVNCSFARKTKTFGNHPKWPMLIFWLRHPWGELFSPTKYFRPSVIYMSYTVPLNIWLDAVADSWLGACKIGMWNGIVMPHWKCRSHFLC